MYNYIKKKIAKLNFKYFMFHTESERIELPTNDLDLDAIHLKYEKNGLGFKKKKKIDLVRVMGNTIKEDITYKIMWQEDYNTLNNLAYIANEKIAQHIVNTIEKQVKIELLKWNQHTE